LALHQALHFRVESAPLKKLFIACWFRMGKLYLAVIAICVAILIAVFLFAAFSL
jgi:hypothetical protein